MQIVNDETERRITVQVDGLGDLLNSQAEGFVVNWLDMRGEGDTWRITDCRRVNYNRMIVVLEAL